jgi:glycosyltransferase involved in cell wall biosynthesis
VVATSTKVDRHYFDDSVLRFFESGNSSALANAIVELLVHPEIGRRMAERASAHAARNTWESRQAEYLSLVDRLCPSD